MPSIGISSIGKCPKNYSTYYKPFKCMTVSSLRAGEIFFVIFDEDKVYFTERLDLESRIRRFFILNNKLIAITDYQGVIVGELNELNNKNYE
jgi:hypothetical protein